MRPKKINLPPDANALYDIAIRALARRARSSGEVRELLRKKKASKADIEAVLHRLRENGYLDDARFARTFVGWRIDNSLQGKARVRRELAARRVKPEIAEEAVTRGYEGVEEAKLLRQYLARKVRVSKPLDSPSKVASLYRRLLRAGFRSDTIVRELRRLLPSSRANSAAEDEPVRREELLDSLSETEDLESEPPFGSRSGP